MTLQESGRGRNKVFSLNLPQGVEKYHIRPGAIVDVPEKIRIQHIPNTSQQRCRYVETIIIPTYLFNLLTYPSFGNFIFYIFLQNSFLCENKVSFPV
jgi:hypothetical protein